MAAGEDQLQPVVSSRLRRLLPQKVELSAIPRVASQPVDRPPSGSRRQPRSRPIGESYIAPTTQRQQQGLLDGLLGQIEIAEAPNERAGQVRGFLAEDASDGGIYVGRLTASSLGRGDVAASWIGRTSTVPRAGQVFAICRASSRLSTSTSV